MSASFFRRISLAQSLAGNVLCATPGSASSSGVFLAAPRRTGKSTFLREDLRPQLESQGALVLYADLWEDRAADPGDVIVAALRAELAKHQNIIKQLARSVGKVELGGVSLSLERVGLGSGISLKEAFVALSQSVKKTIVLIIDEAQHAITTDKGNDALFALKAARDELNSSQYQGLRVVATGSNRDKLAMLRSSKEQAFFGAPLVNFPLLGLDYVQWFCDHVSLLAALDANEVFELFKRASYRPEILGAAADALRFDFEVTAQTTATRFASEIENQISASHAEPLRVLHSLTPLQLAVLIVMARNPENYAPFEDKTISAYQKVIDVIAPTLALKPDVANVQQALMALQDKALVWKAARGVYALEEESLRELMQQEGLLDVVATV